MEDIDNPQKTNLRMIGMPHILFTEKGRIDVMRPAGGNVNDLIRSIGWTPDSLSARVFIEGEYVKDAAWEYTVPRAGQSVIVRAIPNTTWAAPNSKNSGTPWRKARVSLV